MKAVKPEIWPATKPQSEPKPRGIEPIQYDPRAAIVAASPSARVPAIAMQTGVSDQDLAWLKPRLMAARDEVLADLALKLDGRPVPPHKEPLDARFIDLPEQLLGPQRTELDRIQKAADRIAAAVDRVVVLGIGGSYMGARALMHACCHPYHNELPRARRNNRPRMYFEGDNVDNDAVQGLLDVLDGDGSSAGPWAIVVISKSGSTLETAVAFRVFADALRRRFPGQPQALAQHIYAVTQQGSRLWRLAEALGVPTDNLFAYPADVGGRFSVLSAVGLLPAAVLGLDIHGLLSGAAAMNERFRTAAPKDNPVLDYAGVCHLMEARRGVTIRVLSTWGKSLEAVGLWYDQLLAESLGKSGQGSTPLTVVNTRDLHSRGQQHQEGRRDKLITNLVVRRPRCTPVALPTWTHDDDQLNQLAGKTLPEVLAAALAGTNRAYAQDYRRTADLVLPSLDEGSLGQLFQMLMLATVVEGRLLGINPYGQPGVEAYKRFMRQFLRKGPPRPEGTPKAVPS